MTSRIKRPLTVQEAATAIVGTQAIGSIKDGEFVTQWVGTLNGYPVSLGGVTKLDTEDEALQVAIDVRGACLRNVRSAFPQQAQDAPQNPTPAPEQSSPLSFDSATVETNMGPITVCIGYAQRRAKKNRPYCRIYVQQDGVELGYGWLEADFSWLEIDYHGEGATLVLRTAVWAGVQAIADRTSHRRKQQMASLVQELLAESEKKAKKRGARK